MDYLADFMINAYGIDHVVFVIKYVGNVKLIDSCKLSIGTWNLMTIIVRNIIIFLYLRSKI